MPHMLRGTHQPALDLPRAERDERIAPLLPAATTLPESIGLCADIVLVASKGRSHRIICRRLHSFRGGACGNLIDQ